MKTTIHILTLLIVVVAVGGCSENRDNSTYRDAEGAAWNTTYHVTYRSEKVLDDSIIAVMRTVELSLSPFCKTSIISRINRNENARPDSQLIEVFNTSLMVNKLSGGMFDPTVGPLVSLWGFGEAGHDTSQPTAAMIDSALQSVGIGRCQLTDTGIAKPSQATRFNFSAITKGFGCDMVGKMLRRNGCNDYMVEIGGEIALSGHNRRGEPWRIMVDAPVANDSTVDHQRMAVIALTDCGVATSGNYRNFRHTANGTVGHTISPMTGRPVATSTLSATVVAPTAMLADALATACMAMNPDSALAIADKLTDTRIMLVSMKDNGEWLIRTSKQFPEISR